ncbi:tail fiber protein [Acidovorax sp. LjRoot118]|uniref:phage tail protein n=1 Tax=unclassified Acidovorax TaxID=2684926 RepID=UPI003CFF3AB9
MADNFLGEVRIFAFNFAPRNWMPCNGQLIAISSNTALFSLLGTTYGGNGTTTFALPNLNGREPIHAGSGSGLTPVVLGETGGSAAVTLQPTEMPSHNHTLGAVESTGNTSDPGTASSRLAQSSIRSNLYAATATNAATLASDAVSSAGGNLPHNNMPPYLALGFHIAVAGIFPARN